MAPLHPVDEHPNILIHRDLELMEWLDRLGYDEAWIGEHHSGGYETISSPEVFIAAAVERTKHIRLGTGVISLPYHNPLTVVNRIIQLDHQSRGRCMFGFGPGLLVSDARMFGIDPHSQRDRLRQGLDVVLRLLNGEAVTEKTDWYDLVDARIHLQPYTYPRPEIAVASANTPSGGSLAGRYDLGMLCVAATDATGGFNVLDRNWSVACDAAAEQGRTMDRARLRLVGPMHIAETREQARANVRFGLEKFLKYARALTPGRFGNFDGRDPVDVMLENEQVVIGTPDDAVAMLTRLRNKQGEFGVFLNQCHDWANWDATKKSYELYMTFVAPRISELNHSRESSFQIWLDNSDELSSTTHAAAKATAEKFTKV